jgi:putative endonuclease
MCCSRATGAYARASWTSSRSEGDTLAFVEVKSLRTPAYGAGEERVDARKRQRLALLAERFLAAHPDLAYRQCRFDVVVIDYTHRPAQIRLYRNAFDLNG